MSEGPIKRERAAWEPPKVSTTDSARVCFSAASSTGTRGYCGRRSRAFADWPAVTCADCLAAVRADQEAARA